MPPVSYPASFGATGGANPAENGMRLTLESGVPVSSSDQTAKTTIYLTPFVSGSIALYVSGAWSVKTTAQISKALGTLVADKNYDVYAFWTGSAVDLEFVAWTNDTTRATALGDQDGVPIKSGDATRRWVGTFRTTTTTTTEDSSAKRFVYNFANRVVRELLVVELTNNWTYNVTAWRSVNGSAANCVQFVNGAPNLVEAEAYCTTAGQNGLGSPAIGIALDVTNANHAQVYTCAYGVLNLMALYSEAVAPGFHSLNWVENRFGASGIVTFYGDEVQAGLPYQAGMRARIAC